MFGGSQAISLRSGATVRCGSGGDVHVVLMRASGAEERVSLPFPLAGVGGLELVASPDERWLALFIYSGQSEQGWELFALEPALRHVSTLPYQHGEGMAPCFSPDSRFLAMAIATASIERGTGIYLEDLLDPDGDGDVLIDWAMLYVQAVPAGPIVQTVIGTVVPRSSDPDEIGEWNLHQSLEFIAEDRLAIPLPWGARLEVSIPPAGPITT